MVIVIHLEVFISDLCALPSCSCCWVVEVENMKHSFSSQVWFRPIPVQVMQPARTCSMRPVAFVSDRTQSRTGVDGL